MEEPYTKEDLKAMSDKEFLELPKKCSRLHPYCLVGLHIDEVRNRMKEWVKDISIKVELLIVNKDACLMDMNTSYYYCVLDENDIMIDVFNPFE